MHEFNKGKCVSGLIASASNEELQTSGGITYTNKQANLRKTESVGGGVWDHGTGFKIENNGSIKTVYSNYNHPTKYHATKCGVGPNQTSYKRTAPGKVAPSNIQGPAAFTATANWTNNI